MGHGVFPIQVLASAHAVVGTGSSEHFFRYFQDASVLAPVPLEGSLHVLVLVALHYLHYLLNEEVIALSHFLSAVVMLPIALSESSRTCSGLDVLQKQFQLEVGAVQLPLILLVVLYQLLKLLVQ